MAVNMAEPVMEIDAFGTRRWWINDRLHRLDGPAVIGADGYQEWWINDRLHRLDGPAVIGADGSQQWWICGVLLTNEVTTWMQARRITWPWDEATQMEFALTWL